MIELTMSFNKCHIIGIQVKILNSNTWLPIKNQNISRNNWLIRVHRLAQKICLASAVSKCQSSMTSRLDSPSYLLMIKISTIKMNIGIYTYRTKPYLLKSTKSQWTGTTSFSKVTRLKTFMTRTGRDFKMRGTAPVERSTIGDVLMISKGNSNAHTLSVRSSTALRVP
jgi:hypothetical protein